MTQAEKWLFGTLVTVLGLLVLVLIVAPLLLTGHPPDWTGFGTNQSSKALWDWLQLLIIPTFLAVGGFVLARQAAMRDARRTEHLQAVERERIERQQTADRLLAENRAQEAALEGYLDRMSRVLLNEPATQSTYAARALGRAHTVTTLGRLNERRRAFLLQFLRDARFLRAGTASIDLSGLDLSGTDLTRADLSGVDLSGSILNGCLLSAAVLRNVDLSGANLRDAHLDGATLTGATLRGADLRGANFTGATITDDQLAQARARAGLTRPDGTVVAP